MMRAFHQRLDRSCTIAILDEDVFHLGRAASKVPHNCDSYNNLCAQQYEDAHSELCV